MSASGLVGVPASGSWSFGCFVAGEPVAVWAGLTGADRTGVYLHGLAAHSSWIPGARIEFRLRGECALTGQVLCVETNQRLSYLLRSSLSDPPTYLTWLIRPGPGGSTVRLQIDEIEHPDRDENVEDIWLPVLSAFQRCIEMQSRSV